MENTKTNDATESTMQEYFILRARDLENRPDIQKRIYEKYGLKFETLYAAGIGYDASINSTIFPVVGMDAFLSFSGKSGFVANGALPPIFGNEGFFTEKDQQPHPVFIVSDPWEVLAVQEVGGYAVALDGTPDATKHMLDYIGELKPENPVVIALNAGDPVRAKTLSDGLKALRIRRTTASICGCYVSPHDLLRSEGKTALSEEVVRAGAAFLPKPDNLHFYLSNLFAYDVLRYSQAGIKTGFSILDDATGGLYPGLTILAANPGAGKTSFALQIASHAAMSGKQAVYFSFEQNKLDLSSKLLSREIFTNALSSEGEEAAMASCLSAFEIRHAADIDRVEAAARSVCGKGIENLSIVECDFSATHEQLCNYIKGFMQRTGTKPLVVVDYMQLVQGVDRPGQSQIRQTVEEATHALTRFAHDWHIPILAISALNRSSYDNASDYSGLKETGTLEYSASAVFMMGLQVLNSPTFQTLKSKETQAVILRDERRRQPRNIYVACLKSRNATPGTLFFYRYFSAYDTFLETTTPEYGENEDARTAFDNAVEELRGTAPAPKRKRS